MKKITKTVYVVDGREYTDENEAALAFRAKRVEDLLDKLAENNDLYGLSQVSASLAHVIVRNADRLFAAINNPVPVEDGDDTPQARLAARRKRVAAQDKTSTQPCVCANKHAADTKFSEATGCLHCTYCGGVYVNTSQDAAPDDLKADECAPDARTRRHRVHDHQRDTDGLCISCVNRHFHSPSCRFNPRNA